MATEQTTIQGTIYDPTGNPVAGGEIRLQLSQPATAPDTVTSNNERVAGKETVAIGSDGSVNFTLVPNDVMDPTGVVYIAIFELPDGTSWKEVWSIGRAPDPLQIGDITRVTGPSADALIGALAAVTALPIPSASWHRKVLILTTPGEPDLAVICLSDGNGNYGWSELTLGLS